jgi:hypothetical protein
VVDFLARLYPDRPVTDFEAALARTPCTLSHDAAAAAAESLQASLERRGAHVMLIPTDLESAAGMGAVSDAQAGSPEIDLSFLEEAREKDAARDRLVRSLSRPGAPAPAVQADDRAPWED